MHGLPVEKSLPALPGLSAAPRCRVPPLLLPAEHRSPSLLQPGTLEVAPVTPEDTSRAACKFLLYIVHLLGLLFFKKTFFQLFFFFFF